MAHFAQIDEHGLVLQVIVVGNDDCLNHKGDECEQTGIAFCRSVTGEHTTWLQTSYNHNIRKNYAGIGYRYDAKRDAFIPPQMFSDWVLNEDTCRWEPPVPEPTNGHFVWEEGKGWLQVPELPDAD